MIPTIDLTPFYAGGLGERSAVARLVDLACRETGFFTIVGHGIEQASIDELFAVAREFFDLPAEQKLAFSPPSGTIMRGYSPALSQNLARSRGVAVPPDIRESFMIGRSRPARNTGGNDPASVFFGPNPWPAQPARFRPLYEAYYARMEALARDLMRLFALGLELPETYFDDKIDDHFATLNTIHYPPLAGLPDPGQLRAGAHSDFGSLTILAQTASAAGLEVEMSDGTWHGVPPRDGAFVINIGDLMAQWTNDRWRSTVHRVANPTLEGARERRQSLGFFCHPNYDAVVSPLPTCRTGVGMEKYPPIKAGDYMKQKLFAVRNLPATAS